MLKFITITLTEGFSITDLNTSHVKVYHVTLNLNSNVAKNLNTSHVKVYLQPWQYHHSFYLI